MLARKTTPATLRSITSGLHFANHPPGQAGVLKIKTHDPTVIAEALPFGFCCIGHIDDDGFFPTCDQQLKRGGFGRCAIRRRRNPEVIAQLFPSMFETIMKNARFGPFFDLFPIFMLGRKTTPAAARSITAGSHFARSSAESLTGQSAFLTLSALNSVDWPVTRAR